MMKSTIGNNREVAGPSFEYQQINPMPVGNFHQNKSTQPAHLPDPECEECLDWFEAFYVKLKERKMKENPIGVSMFDL